MRGTSFLKGSAVKEINNKEDRCPNAFLYFTTEIIPGEFCGAGGSRKGQGQCQMPGNGGTQMGWEGWQEAIRHQSQEALCPEVTEQLWMVSLATCFKRRK